MYYPANLPSPKVGRLKVGRRLNMSVSNVDKVKKKAPVWSFGKSKSDMNLMVFHEHPILSPGTQSHPELASSSYLSRSGSAKTLRQIVRPRSFRLVTTLSQIMDKNTELISIEVYRPMLKPLLNLEFRSKRAFPARHKRSASDFELSEALFARTPSLTIYKQEDFSSEKIKDLWARMISEDTPREEESEFVLSENSSDSSSESCSRESSSEDPIYVEPTPRSRSCSKIALSSAEFNQKTTFNDEESSEKLKELWDKLVDEGTQLLTNELKKETFQGPSIATRIRSNSRPGSPDLDEPIPRSRNRRATVVAKNDYSSDKIREMWAKMIQEGNQMFQSQISNKSSESLNPKLDIVEEALEDIHEEDFKEGVVHEEASKEEVIHEEASKEEVIYEEYVKEEAIHEEYVKEEVIQVESFEEEAIHEEYVKEEVIHEQDFEEEAVHDENFEEEAIYDEDFEEKAAHDEDFEEKAAHDEDFEEKAAHDEDFEEKAVHGEDFEEEAVHVEYFEEEPVHGEDFEEEAVHVEYYDEEAIHEEDFEEEAINEMNKKDDEGEVYEPKNEEITAKDDEKEDEEDIKRQISQLEILDEEGLGRFNRPRSNSFENTEREIIQTRVRRATVMARQPEHSTEKIKEMLTKLINEGVSFISQELTKMKNAQRLRAEEEEMKRQQKIQRVKKRSTKSQVFTKNQFPIRRKHESMSKPGNEHLGPGFYNIKNRKGGPSFSFSKVPKFYDPSKGPVIANWS